MTEDRLEEIIRQAVTEVRDRVASIPIHRVKISVTTIRQAVEVVHRKYGGFCPCCEAVRIVSQSGDRLPTLQMDHWVSRGKVGPREVWPVCKDCNSSLGEPGYTASRKESEGAFSSYQKRRAVVEANGQISLRYAS